MHTTYHRMSNTGKHPQDDQYQSVASLQVTISKFEHLFPNEELCKIKSLLKSFKFKVSAWKFLGNIFH